ncbi:methionyl-tRNA formyltransferase [Wolbachia endosymbiont of Howardula sp.]|uniref:methionyl-tRNA formyltransferase n=1 Tax=Wolbachia endosymbiont of Howardula sp. TaxID=2916816 RepID=UPI00217E0B25|nr:methionyl-tRNA formyltransferase [Wolbachia endosymbiont of Howardula sp.]UWI83132.1 methionyl-tRNA formyltransferase [Wolbachia endosymbiont of Howardula sp.]
MRVIFMGTSQYAITPLNLLLKSQRTVLAIYTKKISSDFHRKKLVKSSIHAIADHHKITVYTPTSLNEIDTQETFIKLQPDIVIVASYGIMIPQSILSIPKYGCINIHPSLLPRWRGPAPIQNVILSGDQETGVTIIQLTKDLDSGPILKQQKIFIDQHDNYSSLHSRLSELGGNILLEVLNQIEQQVPVQQDHQNACYASKIEDNQIYSTDACQQAYRKVKAFYPKAFVKINNIRIILLDAEYSQDTSHANYGAIMNNKMYIRLKGGILVPKVVHMEGRRPCEISNFLRGFKINIMNNVID